ncbi:MAG: OmpA family protein, partial [Mariprofundales bacterium]
GIKGADWDKDAKIPVYRGGIGKAILLDDNIVLNTQPEPKNLSQYQAQQQVANLHAQAEKKINMSIHFATNSAKLSDNAKHNLSKFISSMSALPDDAIIFITGHADSRGSALYNFKLSGERAQSVARYMAANNAVLRGHLSAIPMGEMQPVIQSGSENLAASRRVQFDLFKHEKVAVK